MNWWICTGKIKGRNCYGAGQTPNEALINAFKA